MDVSSVVTVQEILGPSAFLVIDTISEMGTGPPFVIALLISFLLFGTRVGLKAGLYFFAASYLTYVLKFLIKAPRPYYLSREVIPYSGSDGYGMPSGHAMQNAAALAVPIRYARAKWVSVVLGIFVLLVALSRVYLGVHFPIQVIAGVIGGLCLFAFFEWIGPRVVRWLKQLSPLQQAAVVLSPIPLLMALDYGVIAAEPPTMPQLWQDNYNAMIDREATAEVIALDDKRHDLRCGNTGRTFSLLQHRNG